MNHGCIEEKGREVCREDGAPAKVTVRYALIAKSEDRLPSAQIRHLRLAPIAEAVIDLRVQLGSDVDVKAFASLPSDLAKRYPKRQEQHIFEGEIQLIGSAGVSGPRDLLNGYRFVTPDGVAVVQMRLDGFTFSRLRPYTSWEEVRDEARQLWNHYRSVASVETVTRVAVRFINNFTVPVERTVAEYLTSPAGIPEPLAGLRVGAALTRIQAIDPTTATNCVFTQGLERKTPSGTTVVVDIDVYRTGQFQPSTGEVWAMLEELREMKNRIFFGSITELAARGFE